MRLQFDQEAMRVRWGGNAFCFSSLHEFCCSGISQGVQAINIGEAVLFLYYRPKQSRSMIVHFSGAMVRGPDRHLPYLAGLDLTADLDCAFVAVDDPSLQYAEDLALGWHLGTKDFSLKSILPQIIWHLAEANSVENIVLTGGSGGGFASLLYASIIPSTAVVFNPQTNISRYNPNAYEKYAKSCFEWNGEGDPAHSFGPDIIADLVEYFRITKPPRGIYLQNRPDWHTAVHALPLIAALGGENAPVDQTIGGLSFAFGTWGEGHAPLPKFAYRQLLAEVLQGGDLGAAGARACLPPT